MLILWKIFVFSSLPQQDVFKKKKTALRIC